jgi:hypothetical protein
MGKRAARIIVIAYLTMAALCLLQTLLTGRLP